MAKTRRMTEAEKKARKAARYATKAQALIEQAAYNNLTEIQLRLECDRRFLRGDENKRDMVESLEHDDEQKRSLPAGLYAIKRFTRAKDEPYWPNWNREKLEKRTRSQPDYTTRLEESKAAAAHNDNLTASLLTLPSELRNSIFHGILTAEYRDVRTSGPYIVRNHYAHPFILTHSYKLGFGHEHSLFRVCKLIRTETVSMWFGNHEYRFFQENSHLKGAYRQPSEPFQIEQPDVLPFTQRARILGDGGRLGFIRDLRIEVDCITLEIKIGLIDFWRHCQSRCAVGDVTAAAKAVLEVLRAHGDLSKFKVSMRIRPAVFKELGMQDLGYQLVQRMKW